MERILPSGHLDQIGILVPDLKLAMDEYIATLGVSFRVFEVDETTSSFSDSSSSFRIRFAVALIGFSSIELIQPVSGRTIYSEHLKNRGPGIHHIGFYVTDLPSAKRRLKRREYKALMEGQIRGLGRFAYFEAPDMHCIIEVLKFSITLPMFLAENATLYDG
jgi:hypothetical protein